jgi:hypothetical protein
MKIKNHEDLPITELIVTQRISPVVISINPTMVAVMAIKATFMTRVCA